MIDIVQRWPNNFAAGTLAALESHKHVAEKTSTSTDDLGSAPCGDGGVRTRVDPTNAGSEPSIRRSDGP